MSWDNRIIWSEGTFLQPQHFQQHDRHLEAQLEQRTRALRPHGYGFLEIAIDESLLELGKLALRTARGVLPDGTPFDCPARDPLPPPLDVPATLRDSLVTLALPVRRPGVDEADLGGAGADSLARYVAGELEVKDSNASFDRTALIQIGRLRLQILKEADVTAAYSALGVAKVIERRADNRVMLDQRLRSADAGLRRLAGAGQPAARRSRAPASARGRAGDPPVGAGPGRRRRDRRIPVARDHQSLRAALRAPGGDDAAAS